jgi:Predicted ATPase (AAA+ superfamily)
MEREAYKKLLEWKQSSDRKPLIISGARQTGKTWLLNNFGASEYKKIAYINCEKNKAMQKLFIEDYDMDRIIRVISALTEVDVEPGNTLIVLDELQSIPDGLTSLKYFCEDAPQFHVAAAGSLLGIAIHEKSSFPVGKVDMIRIFPMNFEEFVLAMGKTNLLDILQQRDYPTMKILEQQYIDLLRQYYFVGGMPAAISAYSQGEGVSKIRSIQKQILFDYANDFSKYAPTKEIPRINMVWQSIPSQLAKDNKKFIYGAMKKGARASEFEIAIQWLIDMGLIYKINRINKPVIPLKFYKDLSAFKLFTLDCGLMGALSETPAGLMLADNSIFEEFKSAFTELYVLQQMETIDSMPIYYYSTDDSRTEIDFVIQNGNRVIPIEVKAEENLKAKSLSRYVTDNPHLKGLRFSMSPYRDQEWMENIPLYAILSELKKDYS